MFAVSVVCAGLVCYFSDSYLHDANSLGISHEMRGVSAKSFCYIFVIQLEHILSQLSHMQMLIGFPVTLIISTDKG